MSLLKMNRLGSRTLNPRNAPPMETCILVTNHAMANVRLCPTVAIVGHAHAYRLARAIKTRCLKVQEDSYCPYNISLVQQAPGHRN